MYFNLSRSEKISVPSLKKCNELFGSSLVDQLILSDVSVYRDKIGIDDYLFRIITLKTLPEETFASMIEALLKNPFNFWLSQTLRIPEQKKEYERLQYKRKLTHAMAAGEKNMSDMESESKLSSIEDLISELLESSEKILLIDISIVIKVKTSNAAHLMPVYSYWQGNSRSVCLIPNRDNVLFSIDPFEKSLPNWNGLVIGSSGSGKSFTISQLVLMFYGEHPVPRIVWLDNGASSKGLIDTLGGQFVDVNLSSNICLNPFDLAKNEIIPGPSKIKLILAVIENICKEDHLKSLPKEDKAILEKAIFDTYSDKKGDIPSLTDFKRILEAHPDERMRKYARILYSWTGDSAYGRLLDGKSNVELQKDLVTFEMKGLDAYPDLQTIFLLIVTDFIKREASRNQKQKYLVIADEFWKFLETKAGADFAIESYRTFRKFNAGIWAISQNINDFKSEEGVSNAILQNTPCRIILKQRGVDWREFQRVLALNDTDIEAIRSLRQEKGIYSEFYFIQDENRSILRLESDPLSYLICTTDPEDKSKIKDMREKHPELSYMDLLKKITELEAKN